MVQKSPRVAYNSAHSILLNRTEVVFILLAIHSKQEDKEKFKELGVQEFTTKPLSRELVMDANNKYWSGGRAKEHT